MAVRRAGVMGSPKRALGSEGHVDRALRVSGTLVDRGTETPVTTGSSWRRWAACALDLLAWQRVVAGVGQGVSGRHKR